MYDQSEIETILVVGLKLIPYW